MKKLSIICLALVLNAPFVNAQRHPERPAGDGQRPIRMMGRDPMMEHLFLPAMLREHADELKLTEEQREALRTELEKSEQQFGELRKKVREEMEALGRLLKADKVEEAAANAQLDKVLAAEAQAKKAQLGMLVRVKNILTPEQQAQIREIRQKMTSERVRPPRPEGKGEARPLPKAKE